MRKNRDEFAEINKTRNTGKLTVIIIAMLAFCIIGMLCTKKLQQNERYLTMQVFPEQTEKIEKLEESGTFSGFFA